MSKPGRRGEILPSEEIARFTNRDEPRALFRKYLNSETEPSVLMFYGIGGNGKSWLLRKLRQEVPVGVPVAALDFDVKAGGQRFVLDSAAALYEIREQIAKPTARFDLAFAMLRHKQGAAGESAHWMMDLALELAATVPGGGTALKQISRRVRARLDGTPLERFLANAAGNQFALHLRTLTSQEIGEQLLDYLAADLRESLPVHLHRAVRAVVFFDTFEALGVGLQTVEHHRLREQWIRDIAANFDFALTVIAGQNRLTWDVTDPDWAGNLEQHLIGGLIERDARAFLGGCGIDTALQNAILATSKESDGDCFHCYSLGLCVDIVYNERRRNEEPSPESLRLRPQDWEALARRFLKSLKSDAERCWIERLALTPRFDEVAARAAFSSTRSAAQNAGWQALPGYSFVQRLPGEPPWFAIRAQMCRAVENQPTARSRVGDDHAWWRSYWGSRSTSPADDAASLAWYHGYSLAPGTARAAWDRLAEGARCSVPPRMQEHYELLRWWDRIGLLDGDPPSLESGWACQSLGTELQKASLGSRTANLRQAIACYDAALRVYTEQDFPQDWATTQNNLGNAWSELPSGDREGNLRKAIACYEAALRVCTEQDFRQAWAMTQNNLGNAWSALPNGDREGNLRKAIAGYDAALRVYTEQDFPQAWAMTQNNLGNAWSNLPTGDREGNLRKAIACYDAALRVYTEQDFRQAWATTQNNLGIAWSTLPSGDREGNLRKAVACYDAALRVYTEQDFPQDWAMTQNNLGIAWSELPTGDREDNLRKAIACYEAALRVYTEQDFPQAWAMTQNNLGIAWSELATGDREGNLRKAIACYEAALRVYTEQDFPHDWAMTQNNLGIAWSNLPTGDREGNLRVAIACYEAALRVYTEQDFPQDWAGTQNNLGNAWSKLPSGDREGNLRKAIACYEAALRVHTARDFPEAHRGTTRNLQIAREALSTLGPSSPS